MGEHRTFFKDQEPSRADRKRKKADVRRTIIAAVRAIVLARDGRCRVCGTRHNLTMNEIERRSALRGRPPEEIFNTANCVTLCVRCHLYGYERQGHEREWFTLEKLTEAGADGPLLARWRDGRCMTI